MAFVQFATNVGAAILMGAAIGLERQYRQHPAGLRTNALVCFGAALFVSVSGLVANDSSPSHVAGQVVTGVGFLGGGVILREGFNVRGLATAATMWCSAAVGILAGMGFLAEATVGTVGVLLVHLLLRPVARKIDAKRTEAGDIEIVYRMRVVCKKQDAAVIRAIFVRHINSEPQTTVQGITTQDVEQADETAVVAEIFATHRSEKYLNDLVSRISLEPSVSGVSWEKIQ